MSDTGKQSKRRIHSARATSATAAGEGVADEAHGSAHHATAETTGTDAELEALSIELLASEVHTSFARNRRWGDVSLERVQEVVSALDLTPGADTTLTPRLSLHRLRFTGEKTLTARTPVPTPDPPVAPALIAAASTSTGRDEDAHAVEVAEDGTVEAGASDGVAADTRAPTARDVAEPQTTPPITREAVAYDQRFAPGVNVLLTPRNSAGKSSIFSTIKFALTGDDDSYETDVRGWIHEVWLEFALGSTQYTVHLARTSTGGLTGYLAAGHVDVPLDALDTTGVATVALFADAESARKGLEAFFLERFGLRRLGWTQAAQGAASTERRMSWLTYFQALVIPHASERYLLLDETHSIGNQDGLLLSMLLGLHLAEPINALLLESQKAKSEERVNEEERTRAQAEAARLEAERKALVEELARIDAAQAARRGAVEANLGVRRLRALHDRLGAAMVEKYHLTRRRDELTTEAQRSRARARSLRESADLQLHFTGLSVAVCPNCDADVDEAAVARERQEHHCRLCGKEAEPASPSDVAVLVADAERHEVDAARAAALRDDVSEALRALTTEIARLEEDAAATEAVLRQGAAYALPAPEEGKRRDALLQAMGELRAKITTQTTLAESSTAGDSGAELRAQIQVRARKALQKHAARLNEAVLNRLNGLTRDMLGRIGAESITDVSCSPLGRLTLTKNGVTVAFSSLKSPGERLRIKLAFFVAMMRLGRVQGGGRHPGFLVIDQPGSDEIVEADFDALARVLREVDSAFGDEVQIVCFTARAGFAAATTEAKVYGPQAGTYMF